MGKKYIFQDEKHGETYSVIAESLKNAVASAARQAYTRDSRHTSDKTGHEVHISHEKTLVQNEDREWVEE